VPEHLTAHGRQPVLLQSAVGLVRNGHLDKTLLDEWIDVPPEVHVDGLQPNRFEDGPFVARTLAHLQHLSDLLTDLLTDLRGVGSLPEDNNELPHVRPEPNPDA
jgi:hypothetical protein